MPGFRPLVIYLPALSKKTRSTNLRNKSNRSARKPRIPPECSSSTHDLSRTPGVIRTITVYSLSDHHFFILHLATKIKDGRCLVRTHMIHVVAKVLYKFCINFTLTGLPYFIQHPAHGLGLDHLSSLSDR